MSGQLHSSEALTQRKQFPSPTREEAWWAPGVGLDSVEKRKVLQRRESNPEIPARGPSLYRLSYPDADGLGSTYNFYSLNK
jgi:hypothetical protein